MKGKNYGVYTPQINAESAFLLRRIAWASVQQAYDCDAGQLHQLFGGSVGQEVCLYSL